MDCFLGDDVNARLMNGLKQEVVLTEVMRTPADFPASDTTFTAKDKTFFTAEDAEENPHASGSFLSAIIFASEAPLR